MPRLRISNLWNTLRTTLWFVPATMTVGSIVLAAASLRLDRSLAVDQAWFFLYSGGAAGARSVLSTTAGSMITVAGIAFSTTMVALSFASSELGPRLLRNFMRDRGNQLVLGTFIATFVYSVLVLRTVTEEKPPFVPHIGVSVSLLLALASLGVLIYFIHHAALSLQADYVIGIVAHELDHSIEVLYPGGTGREPSAGRMGEYEQRERELSNEAAVRIALDESGYVSALDVEALMELATAHDLLVRILCRPGGYVHDGIAVAEVWPAGAAGDRIRRKVKAAFDVRRTRTAQQDAEFAINQLVEVAARALSPGVNDPFTAVTCIDRLTTAVLHLMRREFPARFRVDGQGRLRVIAERRGFGGLADAAFDQIRQSGSTLPAVMAHLVQSLTLLVEHAATTEHRLALQRQLDLARHAALGQAGEDRGLRPIERHAVSRPGTS